MKENKYPGVYPAQSGLVNKWTLKITFTINGKVIRKTETVEASTQKKAYEQLVKIKEQLKREYSVGENCESLQSLSFEELVELWRQAQENEIDENKLSPNTLETYEATLNRHIIPFFKYCKSINELDSSSIVKYVDYIKQYKNPLKNNKQLSSKTIKNHLMILSSLMTFAKEHKYISKSPFDDYKYSEGKKAKHKSSKNPDCLDDKQMIKLLELLESEYRLKLEQIEISKTVKTGRYNRIKDSIEVERRANLREYEFKQKQLFVNLAYITSSRRGEVAALKWKDIDIEAGEITFNGNNYFASGTGVKHKDTLKDGSENKVISIDASIFDLLSQCKKLQNKVIKENGWKKSEYLFISTRAGKVQPAGSPVNPDSLTGWFNKFCVRHCEALGLTPEEAKKIHVHTLRHSSISFQLNNGVPLDVIAYRAGHSDEKMIINVYGHVFSNEEKKAAGMFSKFYK